MRLRFRFVAPLLVLAVLAVGCTKYTEANTPGAPHGADLLHTNAFLVCTRLHETPGNREWPYEDGYTYPSRNGYHGAYQFAQSTWDGVVARAGYGQYSGWPAEGAPWYVQDAAAWQLYRERGNQPWGGRC